MIDYIEFYHDFLYDALRVNIQQKNNFFKINIIIKLIHYYYYKNHR